MTTIEAQTINAETAEHAEINFSAGSASSALNVVSSW